MNDKDLNSKLLKLLKGGEAEVNQAFELIYQHYTSDAYRMARRLGGVMENFWDVFQISALALLNKRDKLLSNVKSYFFKTFKREWINKKLFGDRFEKDNDHWLDRNQSGDFFATPDQKNWDDYLRLVKPRCRSIFTLLFVEEGNMDLLAERFGYAGYASALTTYRKCLDDIRLQLGRRKTG